MNYLESASTLTSSLASLTKELTLWKFIRWAITIIIIVAIALYVADRYNSTSYYDRLNKQILILERIKKIESGDSVLNGLINKKLSEVIAGLRPSEKNSFSISQKAIDAGIRIASAFFLPLFAVLGTRDSDDRRNVIYGAVIFVIIFGIIGYLTPNLGSVWVNVGLIPLVQYIILFPFMKRK